MIDIGNFEILEICATVIAGALIFLTISSSSRYVGDILIVAITTIFGLGIIVFFSYVALKTISGKKDLELKHMRRGFLFIIVMSLFLYH